jgi:hypothetical protein
MVVMQSTVLQAMVAVVVVELVLSVVTLLQQLVALAVQDFLLALLELRSLEQVVAVVE